MEEEEVEEEEDDLLFLWTACKRSLNCRRFPTSGEMLWKSRRCGLSSGATCTGPRTRPFSFSLASWLTFCCTPEEPHLSETQPQRTPSAHATELPRYRAPTLPSSHAT